MIGALVVFAVVFAVNALPGLFFLPGDTLLLAAGLLSVSAPSGAPRLSLSAVWAGAAAGALLGAQAGYRSGRRRGLGSLHGGAVVAGAVRAQRLLERAGPGQALAVARYVPVTRSVIAPVCGALEVRWPVFARAQVAGGLVWAVSLPAAGYGVASVVPEPARWLPGALWVLAGCWLFSLVVGLARGRGGSR